MRFPCDVKDWRDVKDGDSGLGSREQPGDNRMRIRKLGGFGEVSELTLGGGGIGMLWGATTEQECIATVRAAIDAGINLFDMAPRYGDGRAEAVIGAAFGGHLPFGVRVTSKCNLGNPPAVHVESILRQSIAGSLERMKLKKIDIFFLHSNLAPNVHPMMRHPEAASRMTPYPLFTLHARDVLERLIQEGLIGAWGLTGIGHPDMIIRAIGEDPAPTAVQCIANLLDSPGGLKFYDGPAKPREVIAAARARNVMVMGIRAVQAGALTAAIDRPLPEDHPDMLDYARAAGFRALCQELGENPAVIAHRYALSMNIDTLVLGVKNRQELAECVAAANAGPLEAALIERIDESVQDVTDAARAAQDRTRPASAPAPAAPSRHPVPQMPDAAGHQPAGGYHIDPSVGDRRRQVEQWLFGLDLVSPNIRDAIVTAWVSTWSSSPYARLEDMPFSPHADYPLMKHVNEVTRAGVDLARRAAADWGTNVNDDVLVATLALHDVDKPLMYTRTAEGLGYSQLSKELPHGVVGAMLLKDLGLPHAVISAVATHAGNAPFHAETFESYVLHYADYYSADHIMMSLGKKPFFQKKPE